LTAGQRLVNIRELNLEIWGTSKLSERKVTEPQLAANLEGSVSLGSELDLLKEARRASGRSLDFWSEFTDGIDQKSLEIILSRAHMVAV